MSDAPEVSLAAAVSQLYGLAPGAFIAQRNALAADAKSAGDRELADRIKRLPKPSLGVWLLNQLARHRPQELGRILGLSAALRRAQDERDGDELRRLSKVRAQVLREVLSAGRALGPELDQAVSDSIAGEAEQALRAALADEDAASALVSGQLVQLLASTGFGGVDLDAALAAPELTPAQVLERPVEPIEPADAGARAPAVKPGSRPGEAAARSTAGPPAGLRSVGPLPGQAAEPDQAERQAEPDQADRQADRQAQAERKAELREADQHAEAAAEAARVADQALAEARHQADETADRLEEIAAELSQLRDHVRDLERAAREARKTAREADRARRRLGSA